MVVFELICINGHRFEGWFQSLSEVESQIEKKEILCPACGEVHLTRCPSTFGLVKSREKKPVKQGHNSQSFPNDPSKVIPKELMDPQKLSQIRDLLITFSEKIQTEYLDVGPNFTQEALKMHYGVAPRKNIRGVSTFDEEKMLKDEGVEFVKFPMLIRKGSVS
jgi:hypothetical protein